VEEKSVIITVYGKVQGVGFRYYTNKKAQSLGLFGFVKNQINGTVYIEVEGDKIAVDLFCEWCNKGSERARVDYITITESKSKGYDKFEVK
jgi:acylphosphatase